MIVTTKQITNEPIANPLSVLNNSIFIGKALVSS